MKRWLWNLAKRLLRSEMLRDVDAVLGQAHEHMVIDARQLHVLDSAFKGDRAIFPAQGRDAHSYVWWRNAARSIARYAALAVLALSAACNVNLNRNSTGPDPVPTATPAPTPSPTPSPATGLVKPTSVRVGFFGGSCPAGSGKVFPNNGAAQVPVGCTGFATATPKRADGTDQTPAEHGTGITWELDGGSQNVDVTAYRVIRSQSERSLLWGEASVQESFNRDVRGVQPGAFSLCATVQGVRGCLNGTVTP